MENIKRADPYLISRIPIKYWNYLQEDKNFLDVHGIINNLPITFNQKNVYY